MLERDDWARLDALLTEALDRPEADRETFLKEACAGDDELRRRVGRLLALAGGADATLPASGGLRGPVFDEVVAELAASGRLEPEDALGRFVVKGFLGEGGMGRVYRALDPGLGREVAIKAVAADVRDDSGSLRRFEREARLLATLNHPNVGAIYGFEVIEGAPYLVLELVEGETLAERLQRGPLPMGEALAVGVQVADALQEAHRQGIVHRDLKPANVKLGDSGRVKVLDFGLAKPVGPSAAEAATPEDGTALTTMPGTLLGTAHYMSPEQVRDQPIDTRSDMWAFGCLLYEMLTGRRAFAGRTTSDVLASILRDEPDFDALPADTPRGVRRLLRRCLRKNARDRQQDAGDARLELTEAAMDEPADPAPKPARRAPVALLVALAAAAGVAGALLLPTLRGGLGRSASPVPVRRLFLDLPPALALADDYAAPFALSRDGSTLALVAREGGVQRLFFRGLDSILPTPVPGSDGAWQPAFSPDGRAVAFIAERKVLVARLPAGEVKALGEVGGNARGVAWADDGTIVVAPSQNAPLHRMSERGGALVPLTRLGEREVSHRWPQALPNGLVLFTVAVEDRTYDDARIEVVSLATGERTRLVEGGAHGRYLASGHLVFARQGRLLATRLDLSVLRTEGEPEVVVDGVRYDPQNGGTHVAVSEDGTLVYSPGTPISPERGLAFVDGSGEAQRILDPPRVVRDPRLSPDGRKVALVLTQKQASDLWLLDVASGTLSQLTFGLSPRRPTWTPDGKSITVGAPAQDGRWRLLSVPARSGASPATLLETASRAYPNDWSPDGRTLVFQERGEGTGWDLFAADLSSASRLEGRRALATTPADEENAGLSPDGRLLAYESNELDGVFEIYVRVLREGGATVRASTSGARWPRFAPGGRLYFWQSGGGGLRRLDYPPSADRFRPAPVIAVWGNRPGGETAVSRRFLVGGGDAPYDVDPAGKFLMLQRILAGPEPAFRKPVVVLGFGPALKGGAR